VHNEEKLLVRALKALELAFSHIRDAQIPSQLVLIFDSCRDASVGVANEWAEDLSQRNVFSVRAITCDVRNVGIARRLGCASVLDHWKDLSAGHVWIATTDADSQVPRTWLREQVRHHEGGTDVWAGRVAVTKEEGRAEAVSRWQREYDREAQPIHGASLGFNGAQYLAAGGFSPIASGEDRALLHALMDLGAPTYFDSSLRVLTSARRRGRAPHGFAEAFHRFDSPLGAIAD
jgi:hypothetical protein